MTNQGLQVDASQLLNFFSSLSGNQQKSVYRNALRKASRILLKETKVQLKNVVGRKINDRNSWNGKTFGSGIKFKINNEATEGKVHIMGDFRLKFFEKGTRARTLRKNGASRGSMTANYFFRTAKTNKEQEIFSSIDTFISESIRRIANRP